MYSSPRSFVGTSQGDDRRSNNSFRDLVEGESLRQIIGFIVGLLRRSSCLVGV